MGVKIFDIVHHDNVELSALKNKVIAIDSFNVLYQFLSSIRGPDGALLEDSKGRVTSHLSGLFSRTMRLLTAGVKPVYVFDGQAPELKKLEQKKRSEVKKAALEKYEVAKQHGSIDDMKKYASRTSKLTNDMIEDAKRLIAAMGVPIVQAPSEGEAQASFMCKQGDVYAAASQDGDSLLFGTPRLIKNLTMNNRRRLPGSLGYAQINIEKFELKPILAELELTQEQLIVLGILVGTDFNPGGIKGIGPKKALGLLKKHGTDFEALFDDVKWSETYDFSYTDIMEIFTNIPVEKNYKLDFSKVDREKIISILVEDHEFDEGRTNSTLEKYEKELGNLAQKSLSGWFG